VAIADPAFAVRLVHSAAYLGYVPSCHLRKIALLRHILLSLPTSPSSTADLAACLLHTQYQISRVAQRAILAACRMGHAFESGQTPPDPHIDHRVRNDSLSTLGASFLSATPTSGNFVQLQVWWATLSLDFRLSINDYTILPLYCHQCHTTRDSERDRATLSCRRTSCGRGSGHEHIKLIFDRVGLRAEGLKCTFQVPMPVPQSEKPPGDLFRWLETPYL
jgi:hypothetical protein